MSPLPSRGILWLQKQCTPKLWQERLSEQRREVRACQANKPNEKCNKIFLKLAAFITRMFYEVVNTACRVIMMSLFWSRVWSLADFWLLVLKVIHQRRVWLHAILWHILMLMWWSGCWFRLLYRQRESPTGSYKIHATDLLLSQADRIKLTIHKIISRAFNLVKSPWLGWNPLLGNKLKTILIQMHL